MGTVLAMMCCFAWKKANLFSHNRKKHNPQKKIKNVHLHIYPSPYSSPISTINLIDYIIMDTISFSSMATAAYRKRPKNPRMNHEDKKHPDSALSTACTPKAIP
jgi:hypothetical protein